jgi:peptidoglycan/xylan/chitin deacetylase (PgdA/CDA1 family)
LILGRPTIAFGESGYEGLITPGNFAERMKTNFGDTGIPRPVNKSEVTHDIAALLKARPSSPRTLRAAAQSHFDVAVVEPRVREVYYRSRARMNSASRIPVLMYHRVVDRPLVESKHGIWVTAVRFRKQLNSLRIRGFSPITFVDYKRFLDGEARLPANPIILTFDDGYQDNYELAFPALQDFGFKAVVYLVADAERRTNFWDPDEPSAPLLSNGQIREMASSGIEFGSHTVTHPRLPEISERQIRQELKDSKSAIEQIVGSEVLSLAYPYGAVNPFVRLIAAEEGYTFAAAGNTGPVRFSEDFLEIRRTQVFPWTGSLGFWKKTQPWYLRYKTL